MRAIVICAEEPLAIVGIAREKNYNKLFSEYKSELSGKLKSMTILRAIKTVMQWVAESPLPVVAIAQPQEKDAPELLRRLGFEFHSPGDDGDVYIWHG